MRRLFVLVAVALGAVLAAGVVNAAPRHDPRVETSSELPACQAIRLVRMKPYTEPNGTHTWVSSWLQHTFGACHDVEALAMQGTPVPFLHNESVSVGVQLLTGKVSDLATVPLGDSDEYFIVVRSVPTKAYFRLISLTQVVDGTLIY